jgi:hypothetical protein
MPFLKQIGVVALSLCFGGFVHAQEATKEKTLGGEPPVYQSPSESAAPCGSNTTPCPRGNIPLDLRSGRRGSAPPARDANPEPTKEKPGNR